MLTRSAIDHGFDLRSRQTIHYKNWYLLILRLAHTALRYNKKDQLALSQDNVSSGDTSISRLNIQLSELNILK